MRPRILVSVCLGLVLLAAFYLRVSIQQDTTTIPSRQVQGVVPGDKATLSAGVELSAEEGEETKTGEDAWPRRPKDLTINPDVRRQFSGVIGPAEFSIGADELHALEAQIEPLLRGLMIDGDKEQTLERFSALIADIPRPVGNVGSMAINVAGRILTFEMLDDTEFSLLAYERFLDDDDPMTQAMIAIGLMHQNGYPPDIESSWSRSVNLVPGLEYDLAQIAMETNDEFLRATLAVNVPKAGNYELDDSLVSMFLDRGDVQSIANAGDMIRSVVDTEDEWRRDERYALIVPRPDTMARYSGQFVELARSISDTEEVEICLSMLIRLGVHDSVLRAFRHNLNGRFDDSFLSALDTFLDGNLAGHSAE